jgi:asparagine synthase (glutamine-hydrolysing)
MCGIAGIYHYRGDRSVDPETLAAMTGALAHRGPDDTGLYVAGPVGLGHRRLSIVDLSEAGRNPMTNEDESLWLVFNGEVYNVLERRDELAARGHRFRSHTDSEMLLHLYEEKGADLVHELRGMFGFALWDSHHRTLLVARDRLGIKPLYWRATADTFAFASELKGLLADPECPRAVAPAALEDYLTYQYVPSPSTILADVHKLEPGHLLLVSPAGVVVRRWWSPPVGESSDLGYEDATAELRRLLEEAVRLRFMSDVPIGAFLSGGIDSSIVCALMAKLMDEPVKTFTIGFEGAEEDETQYARRVAAHLGSEHHEFVVRPDALAILPRLVWHLDEPLADPSALPTWAVSEIARSQVKVAFSGDGGDETFAGYESYRYARKYLELDRIPAPLRRLLARMTGGGSSRLHTRIGRLAMDPAERFLEIMTISGAAERRALLGEGVRAQLDGRDALDWARAHRPGAPVPLLSSLLHLDLTTYLTDDVLAKVDRMSMAHALEVRVPLLDHVLVEFAARLPLEYKLRGATSKAILKAAVKDLLPPDILARGKQGFAVPLARWFGGAFDTFVRDTLSHDAVVRRGMFAPAAVDELIARACTGPKDPRAGRLLWAVIVFELWARAYLDDAAPRRDSGFVLTRSAS